jgi:hypothetical protein
MKEITLLPEKHWIWGMETLKTSAPDQKTLDELLRRCIRLLGDDISCTLHDLDEKQYLLLKENIERCEDILLAINERTQLDRSCRLTAQRKLDEAYNHLSEILSR